MKGGEDKEEKLPDPYGWLTKQVTKRAYDLAGPDGRKAVAEFARGKVNERLRDVLPAGLAEGAVRRVNEPAFIELAKKTANEFGKHAILAGTALSDVLKQQIEAAMERERSAEQQEIIATSTQQKAEQAIIKLESDIQVTKILLEEQKELEAQEIEAKKLEEAKIQREIEEYKKQETKEKVDSIAIDMQNLLDQQNSILKNIQERQKQAMHNKQKAIEDKQKAHKELIEAEKIRQKTLEQAEARNAIPHPGAMPHAIPVGGPFYNPLAPVAGMRRPEAPRG